MQFILLGFSKSEMKTNESFLCQHEADIHSSRTHFPPLASKGSAMRDSIWAKHFNMHPNSPATWPLFASNFGVSLIAILDDNNNKQDRSLSITSSNEFSFTTCKREVLCGIKYCYFPLESTK